MTGQLRIISYTVPWLVQSLTGLGSLPWAVSAPIVEHRYFWAMMSQMAHAPVVPVSPLIKQGLWWLRCLLGTICSQVRWILPCNQWLSHYTRESWPCFYCVLFLWNYPRRYWKCPGWDKGSALESGDSVWALGQHTSVHVALWAYLGSFWTFQRGTGRAGQLQDTKEGLFWTELESWPGAGASGRADLLPCPQKRGMSLLKEEGYGWTFWNKFSHLGGDSGDGDPTLEVSCCHQKWNLSVTALIQP